jgi:hypothetical protein
VGDVEFPKLGDHQVLSARSCTHLQATIVAAPPATTGSKDFAI